MNRENAPKILPFWPTLGLLVMVLLAMGRVVTNEFTTWDDPDTVYLHPAFVPPTWSRIPGFWNPTNVQAGLWVPFTYTVWGVLAQAAQLSQADEWGARLNPAVFHAASLGVHLIATLLVFSILRRILTATDGDTQHVWSVDARAWIGAAVFAVHPLQVESVAWTSGLKDVLWGMWALAAVACYMCWLDDPKPSKRFNRSGAWWWAGLLCFVLGTLSKPTAMVTPALVVVIHAVALGGGFRKALAGTWPWFVFVPVVMVWTRLAQPGGGVPTLSYPLRPLIAADTLAFYTAKILWPMNLGFDYGRTPAVILESGAIWWTWVVPAVIAGLAVWVWKARRKSGSADGAIVPTGVLWFVIACSPVLGATPFLFQYYSTVSDHYVYASMAGVAMVVAWGAGMIRLATGTIAKVAVVVVLGFWTVRSAVQMGTWKDSDTLYAQGLKVNPRSFASMTNIGGMWLYKGDFKGGGSEGRADYKRAMGYYDRAVATRDDYSVAWDYRAVTLLRLGEREAGINSLRKALELSAKVPRGVRGPMMVSNMMLGQYFVDRGRFADALPYLQAAETENAEVGTLPPADVEKLKGLLERARAGAATQPAPTPVP